MGTGRSLALILGDPAGFLLSVRHVGGRGLQREGCELYWRQHRCTWIRWSSLSGHLVIDFVRCGAGDAGVRPLPPEA